MKVTKRVDLELLEQELEAALVPINALGHIGTDTDGDVFTYDGQGVMLDLPPEAEPVVAAHVAPPAVTEFVAVVAVDAFAVTTDDQPVEVFRFPCQLRHLYEADLKIKGVDRANFATRQMHGEFAWKRGDASAIMTGITVVSTLGEAASASWAPNAVAAGTDIVFSVKGAAGRTIDWFLVGTIGGYAPGGLEG